MNYILNKDELMHHGILGMKWGIRRYQYKDGSLTSAGRKRYGHTLENANKYLDFSTRATKVEMNDIKKHNEYLSKNMKSKDFLTSHATQAKIGDVDWTTQENQKALKDIFGNKKNMYEWSKADIERILQGNERDLKEFESNLKAYLEDKKILSQDISEIKFTQNDLKRYETYAYYALHITERQEQFLQNQEKRMQKGG